jgi:hypothetical protein
MYIDPKKLKDIEKENVMSSTLTPDQLSKLNKQVSNEGTKDLESLSSPNTVSYEKMVYPTGELGFLSFLSALEYAIKGKRITKEEWHDYNIYCTMVNGLLSIVKYGEVHQWIISEGDTVGNDWVIFFHGGNNGTNMYDG